MSAIARPRRLARALNSNVPERGGKRILSLLQLPSFGQRDELRPGIRGGGGIAARDRRLISGYLFNFQKNLRRFIFQRIPHLLVILLGELPCAVFKFQVAQIS